MESATTRTAGGAAVVQTIDLRDRPLPVGRTAQLRVLRTQMEWAQESVIKAQRRTSQVMRSTQSSEGDRWDAVQALRTLVWKVCLEILPLPGKVPLGLQNHPEYMEVLRTTHALRRATEDALRDNANYTVDLAAADRLVGRRG